MAYGLQITEANHADDRFYTLGGILVDSKRERDAELAKIPAFDHDCAGDDRCYILDILERDGFSVADDREISAETAAILLGTDDFERLREQDRQRWDAVLASSQHAEVVREEPQ